MIMFKVVKTPPPDGKKLFEWNSEKKMLSLARKKRVFLYELGADNEFTYIAESDKLLPKGTSKN